ncbi:MAG: TlpA family protein disulfide reductase [Acidimicrobiales bacterium]
MTGAGPPGETPRTPHPLRALSIGTAIAAVLAVLLFVGLARSSPVGPTSGSSLRPVPSTGGVVPVGSPAPDFTLPALSGGPPVNLDALGRDRHRAVVLNFFASWCEPCRQETPLLAHTAAASRAKGSSVQFIGVDVHDPTAQARRFVSQSGVGYPVAIDRTLAVTSGLYGLTGQPQTFFINRSGVVMGHVLGPLDASTLAVWLDRLSGPAPAS